ncbi:DNA-formamidopyrimidine glycosylase [Romeria aff. gracilis LEGE 07310]|uniref:Formamidopyrimidine-DNA glycosylase n=1 Tax=Vasconcelosia minhoensis LEGE 07310 TaxID=915328 RepID=A0A8J7AJE2_9CYAN|nr:DNA-formamidopyrimidine glycosylase [Romeria gracilis]MBE9078688.1 DNA-formamidopyrimidine glycosylase [Romeria aff. gracilis LEGE 07310]
MPELPEVETVCRGLNRVTLNQPVRGGEVRLERTIAYPLSATDFLAGLKDTSIIQWQRRGKYLLAQLRDAQLASAGWLGVHLRMTGQLLWVKQSEPLQSHCRVRLFFDAEQELRYVDQRTFGRLWWVPPERQPETIMTGLQRLGPEPFEPAFSALYLAQSLKGRQRPIKNSLLDQGLVAGIGNIYADEALFLSGMRPQTISARIGRQRATRLHQAIRQVLTTSIDSGGTTFSDFRDVHGVNGNYGGVAWVYDRAGLPCRVCGTSIQRLKLAGRSAHYCPRCQR